MRNFHSCMKIVFILFVFPNFYGILHSAHCATDVVDISQVSHSFWIHICFRCIFSCTALLSFSFLRASENKFLLIFHWNESYRRFIQHNSSKYFSSFHSLHLCHEHLDFRFYYYSTDHALCILRMTLLQVHVIWNLFGDSVSYLENWTSVAGAKINGKSNEQVQNLKKIP